MVEKAFIEIRAGSDRLEAAGSIASRLVGDLLVSKQKLRQAEAIQLVRINREREAPNLGFASRPFVLCGLPSSALPKALCCMSAAMASFCCRLPVTGTASMSH